MKRIPFNEMRAYEQKCAREFEYDPQAEFTTYKKRKIRKLIKKREGLIFQRHELDAEIYRLSHLIPNLCPHKAEHIILSRWAITDTLGHIDTSGHSYDCSFCGKVLEEREH